MPLAEIAEVFTDGNWIESKDQARSGIRLVQTGNVGAGAFRDRKDKARFINEETFARLNCFEVLPGDVLISRLPDPVGRACEIPATGDRMISAVDCSIIRTDETVINTDFLVYYTQTAEYLQAVDAYCTGTTRRRISRKNLGKVLVPVPSLDEQKRIVAVLDQAFAALDRARAGVETNLKNAQLIFERSAAEIFSNVSAWARDTQPVSEIAEGRKGSIRTGPFGSQLKHSEFVDSGVRVLGIDNAVKNSFQWGKPRHITEDKYKQLSRYRVFPDDVVITIMGTCGRCAITPADIPKAINTKHLCCITLDQTKCLPEYLHRYFLLSPKALEYLDFQTKGTVMNGLNMGIIKALPVDLPDVREQKHICQKIRKIEQKTEALTSRYAVEHESICQLRRSLLKRAFSGALV